MQGMKHGVTLTGRLGGDVQMTTLSTGKKIARAVLATQIFRFNRSGKRIKQTQWHNVVGWGRKADAMERYLSRGQLVMIHGRSIRRTYEDSFGQVRHINEVVVSSFTTAHRQAS